MLFRFSSAKNRTSGPKGHKDDDVHTGDKSPAYPETEFAAACQPCARRNRLLRFDDCSVDGAIGRVGPSVPDGAQRILRCQLLVDVDAETRFAAAV